MDGQEVREERKGGRERDIGVLTEGGSREQPKSFLPPFNPPLFPPPLPFSFLYNTSTSSLSLSHLFVYLSVFLPLSLPLSILLCLSLPQHLNPPLHLLSRVTAPTHFLQGPLPPPPPLPCLNEVGYIDVWCVLLFVYVGLFSWRLYIIILYPGAFSTHSFLLSLTSSALTLRLLGTRTFILLPLPPRLFPLPPR